MSRRIYCSESSTCCQSRCHKMYYKHVKTEHTAQQKGWIKDGIHARDTAYIGLACLRANSHLEVVMVEVSSKS